MTNGIFICFECAAKHRSYGTHISFVRSCNFDKWKRKQLKLMEFGGNKQANLYFNKYQLNIEGIRDYKAPQATRYRRELNTRVINHSIYIYIYI